MHTIKSVRHTLSHTGCFDRLDVIVTVVNLNANTIPLQTGHNVDISRSRPVLFRCYNSKQLAIVEPCS